MLQSLEHQEALVDLTVTLGKPSHGYSDAIFTSPGPAGSSSVRMRDLRQKLFLMKMLWMLPIRTRTTELGNVNSMQRAATMSESKKTKRSCPWRRPVYATMSHILTCSRNAVPISFVAIQVRHLRFLKRRPLPNLIQQRALW